MTRKRRDLHEEEARLWAHATRDVKPRRARKLPPLAKTAETGKAAPMATATKPPEGPKSAAHKPAAPAAPAKEHPLRAIDPRTVEKLRKGRREIDGRIDLHGLTQDKAHAALCRYILRASEKGLRTVLVITGKGGREARGESFMPSDRPGVLRARVPHWLEEAPLRPLVWGIEEAGRGHGGSGAYYVLLKRARPKE